MKLEARNGLVYASGNQLVAQFHGTNAPALAREYTSLKNEIAAYQLLHQSVIREYQKAMHADSDPGVGAAAEQMRQEIEELRASAEIATTRWRRAELLKRALIHEMAGMNTALQTIRDTCGHVCSEFDRCNHVACRDSFAAWHLANSALGEPKQ